ncbi:hypothetical protein DFH06DRAFT_1324300 [Mycena polygramma]|nr:hypothetical protein DFH06DRAFT_1335678 [Mycena polygramma]KAJ7663782.1 hypothetical protein DFH06DRAFT_1324300 [Mycena polygramma]
MPHSPTSIEPEDDVPALEPRTDVGEDEDCAAIIWTPPTAECKHSQFKARVRRERWEEEMLLAAEESERILRWLRWMPTVPGLVRAQAIRTNAGTY